MTKYLLVILLYMSLDGQKAMTLSREAVISVHTINGVFFVLSGYCILTNGVFNDIINIFIRFFKSLDYMKGDSLPGKVKKNKEKKVGAFQAVFNTAEWLIMAFAVTLVFIVFVMQAYTIPTGSMADTLRGAHFRLRCKQCGYRYDHGFRPEMYGYKTAVTPGKQYIVERPNGDDIKRAFNSKPWPKGDGRWVEGVRTVDTLPIGTAGGDPKCPSCGYYMAPVQLLRQEEDLANAAGQLGTQMRWELNSPDDRKAVPSKGDRIFVLKCIYQFMDPKRWDVFVFKNPVDPKINYIKRLIGLPGETIELIDGDVYADGEIARKPADVQEELWMCVYENDYVPVNPGADHSVAGARRFNGKSWKQPFVNSEGSSWDMTGDGGRLFSLSSDVENTIVYDTTIGNDFKATYAYDLSRWYSQMPICSDVMVSYYVARDSDRGAVGAGLSKYGRSYRGWLEADGRMAISEVLDGGEEKELVIGHCVWPLSSTEAIKARFAIVDHELVLEFGETEIRYDLGRGADDAGQRIQQMPVVSIAGRGKLRLSHISVFRDIHYSPVVENIKGVYRILRAGEGDPFELGEDEYFACGDNSAASSDSRMWSSPGKGNNGHQFRMGVVPDEYLIGKAFFVYWPGGFQPKLEKGLRLVPHVGGMKVIAGGE